MFMLLRCEVMRRLPALGQKCHFQLVLMHLTIIVGRSHGALTTRVCLWADVDLAPCAALRFRPNPFVLSRLSPFHGCVFTAGDRLCLGCATGNRSRGCPSAQLLLPAHPRFPPGRAAAGSRGAPWWLGAPAVGSTRGAGRPRHGRLPRRESPLPAGVKRVRSGKSWGCRRPGAPKRKAFIALCAASACCSRAGETVRGGEGGLGSFFPRVPPRGSVVRSRVRSEARRREALSVP